MMRPMLLAVSSLVAAGLATPVHAATCEALSSLALSNGRVTLAQDVTAGGFTPPTGRARSTGAQAGRSGGPFAALPAFCRVAVTLTPTPRSDINAEVWLPAAGWNGKLLVVGNGGFAGTIPYPAMATAIAGGYATASTDTGHTGPASNTFVNEDVLVDYAHRAVHETTAAAKRVIDSFYGRPQQFAYFSGCSTGGRQGLQAAQRYPGDFDGIVAGAPGLRPSRQAFGQNWLFQAQADPASVLPDAARARLHEAVMNACDAQDGARDGVLENPMACGVDPQVLACRGGAGESCLTPPQVEAARKIYSGPVNPRTGEPLFPGLERGSELGWSPGPVGLAADYFRYVVFKDPEWDPRSLNFDAHVALADARPERAILDADETDLSAFTKSGKLLLYQGWADPGIPPRNVVHYYERVQAETPNASDAVRLFMVPGMGHCGGGTGVNTFDMVAALDRWVTTGDAPDSIPASRVEDGTVVRTRPLCAYPEVALYDGSGSVDDAANFECRAP